MNDKAPSEKRSRWHRWFVQPVLTQLTRGISPEKLSWTIALAVVCGVFPIMGTTSVLCLLAGWALRLNQPVLQAFNTLMYPLHLVLILVFIRMGERLYGVPPITLSIPELLDRFRISPTQFARDFGWAAWHGVSAWLMVAPVIAVLIKWSVVPLLRRISKKIHAGDIPA